MAPRQSTVSLAPAIHFAAAALLVAGVCLIATSGPAAAAGATAGSHPPGPSDDASCVPQLAAGSQTVTLDIDGSTRDVIVHIPEVHAADRWPAVVAFHGYSSFATDMEATSGLSGLADEEGFVVAYPQALGSPTQWHFAGNLGYDQRDFTMTQSLLDLLVDQACVDQDRIVFAGHSMGGGMASDTACRLADQVAGVVLVAALWFELPCQPVRPLPVLAMHALNDPLLPYAGGPIAGTDSAVPEQLPVETAVGAWAAHAGCDESPDITTMPDGGAVLRWPACIVPIELQRLPAGGHDWPAVASESIARAVLSWQQAPGT